MGKELSPFNSFERYRYSQHRSDNQYRTETFSQPRAIRSGDKLANEWVVRGEGEPFTDIHGLSLLFNGHPKRYVPARLPLQLRSIDEIHGVLPQDLSVGDVLQTGCIVLEPPHPTDGSTRPTDQHDVVLNLSGGQRLQAVATPDDLELAVYGTVEDLGDADDPFTQLVVEKLSHLRARTLQSLADHALFETVLTIRQ